MTLHIDLITPERQVLSDDVDSLVAPAVDGEIGILPHHTPLLTQLGMGELRLKKGNNVTFVAITGGFMEVQKGSTVQVFAETAELAHEINIERARLAVERAQALLKAEKQVEKMDFALAEAALSRAILRMKIGQNRRTSVRPTPPEVR